MKYSLTKNKSVAFDDTEKPRIIDGLEIKEHKSLGKVDLSKMKLFLSEGQRTGWIKKTELKKLLAGKKALNANVLDYLLEHQELIPQEWRGKWVLFWGTIYRNSDGDLFVRYLHWNGAEWDWNYHWLDDDFNAAYPAALAS